MTNEEANWVHLSSRVDSTSTPSSTQKETAYEKNLREFLNRDSSLHFNKFPSFYSKIMEEKDDCHYRWYPMYIHYSRKKRAIDLNDGLRDKGYETFLYIREPPKDYFGNPVGNPNQGPLYSIIFVHAMKIQLKLLKRYDGTCDKLKFMTSTSLMDNQATRIIWIPDRQMENFIDAANRPDPMSQRIPLHYNDFIDKEGRKVIIVDGPFAGIEGEIKRIGRHRIVVALVRDACVAIGITHIAPENLEFRE